MQQKQSQQQQHQHQQLKIPQTIQSHKLQILKWKAFSTVIGIDVTANQKGVLIRYIVSWMIVFATFVVLKFIPSVQYGVVIGVCAGVCVLSALVNNVLSSVNNNNNNSNNNNQTQNINIPNLIYNLIISPIYGWLWSHQLYYSSNQPSLIILSLISIATSLGTICIKNNNIRQFSSPTVYITQPNIHSTLYIRLLLPLPLFIVSLILDYGQFLSPQTNHLFYIRLSISLVFLTWTLGWISTLYSVYYFIVNNINRFLFGDEGKHSLLMAVVNVVLNCVPIAIYYRFAEDQYLPVWILWVGSTITAIVGYSIGQWIVDVSSNNNDDDKQQQNKIKEDDKEKQKAPKATSLSNYKRTILSIILQILICASLLAIMLTCDFVNNNNTSSLPTSLSIKIITIINTCLYVLFKTIHFIAQPRNIIGLSFNINILNTQYIRFIQRIVMRISSGLVVIIMVQNLSLQQLWIKLYQTVNFDVDIKFVQYFFYPFIVYRSYKRTLSQSVSFSLHLSILIALGFIHQGYQLQAISTIMFFPPFPQNFIMTIITPFTTPPKLRHRTQWAYQLIYLCITTFSLIIFILSIGMLQFTMVFGLPFYWCVIPNINENSNKIKSKQHSLYQKIVAYIPTELFRYRSQGFYLLRISKYILLVQIKSTNYGFAQTIDIKGLQVQQVTSCHSKQGDTIDRLVQQTWGDNKSFFITNINNLFTVLSPLTKSVINVPTQNQIQLTGIIQSKQFVQLFKKATLKALVYELSKIKYSQQQLLEGQEIISDLQPICKQQKYQSTFPFQLAKQLNFQIQYPSSSSSSNSQNIQVKKKLPPIKNKNAMVSDFLDLLDTSQKFDANNNNIKAAQTSAHYLNSQIKQKEQQLLQQSKQQQKHHEGSQKDLMPNNNKLEQTSPKISIKQLNASLVMTLYHYTVGKFDYLNIRKVHDLIKMQKGELNQVKFQQSQKIVSDALCMGMKIAIDKITMGEEDIELSDFQEYKRDAYLGIVGSQGYNDAVSRDVSDIWTLNYGKGKLSVKRLSKSENQLYLFKADSMIIKSVWNNLRFQLMYATNDNDQRYSIQTHPYLMRNLWTQACQQPFGYPSYHSGVVMNR